jgi:hypothetical protein
MAPVRSLFVGVIKERLTAAMTHASAMTPVPKLVPKGDQGSDASVISNPEARIFSLIEAAFDPI